MLILGKMWNATRGYNHDGKEIILATRYKSKQTRDYHLPK
jgi:hypothetical protein